MNRSLRQILACCLVAFGLTQTASADVIPSPSNDIALQSNGGLAYSSQGSGSYDGNHNPPMLNDGNRDGNYGDIPIGLYHSASTGGGSFGVTLSGLFNINDINVFNRNGYEGRLDGNGAVPFTAEVLKGGVVQWSNTYTYSNDIVISGADGTAEGKQIAVPNVIGNEVRIIENYTDVNQSYINIAEVEAFGQLVPEPSSVILCGLGAIGLFIAARRRRLPAALACCLVVAGLTQTASAVVIPSPANDIALASNGGVAYVQSGLGSLNSDHTPVNLNDGNEDGNYYGSPFGIYHSSSASGGYFGVTLNGLYRVNDINLFNRTDCCGSRIDTNSSTGASVPFTAEVLKGGVVQWSGNYNFVSAGNNISITVAGGDSPNGDAVASGRIIAVPSIIGDDVRIIQNNAELINIAEVEAFGQSVPEPSSVILFGLAAIGLFVAARRRRKA